MCKRWLGHERWPPRGAEAVESGAGRGGAEGPVGKRKGGRRERKKTCARRRRAREKKRSAVVRDCLKSDLLRRAVRPLTAHQSSRRAKGDSRLAMRACHNTAILARVREGKGQKNTGKQGGILFPAVGRGQSRAKGREHRVCLRESSAKRSFIPMHAHSFHDGKNREHWGSKQRPRRGKTCGMHDVVAGRPLSPLAPFSAAQRGRKEGEARGLLCRSISTGRKRARPAQRHKGGAEGRGLARADPVLSLASRAFLPGAGAENTVPPGDDGRDSPAAGGAFRSCADASAMVQPKWGWGRRGGPRVSCVARPPPRNDATLWLASAVSRWAGDNVT